MGPDRAQDARRPAGAVPPTSRYVANGGRSGPLTQPRDRPLVDALETALPLA
jgi:hypothetical protein